MTTFVSLFIFFARKQQATSVMSHNIITIAVWALNVITEVHPRFAPQCRHKAEEKQNIKVILSVALVMFLSRPCFACAQYTLFIILSAWPNLAFSILRPFKLT